MDDDSDYLQAAEDEARGMPLHSRLVKAFDKSLESCRRRRRYIERNFDLSDDDLDDTSGRSHRPMTDTEFKELFQSHTKRKRLRKKIRANPEVGFVDFVPYLNACSLVFFHTPFCYILKKLSMFR